MIAHMKVLVLYRPDSEHATATESFVRDFKRQHDMGSRLELLSIDTREGAATASLYDIMAYPIVLAIAVVGRVLNVWPGPGVPLMVELAGYLH